MKILFFIGLIALVTITTGCSIKSSIYTNDVIYDCKDGDYYFPDSEPVFEKVSLAVVDFNGLKENLCSIYPEYKVKVKPDPSNPYYEMETDVCSLTVGQLAYFKEKEADLITMLKDASCDFKTNLFLPEVSKTTDFKGQTKIILSEFGTSTTEFTGLFEDWVNGVLSYEEFQEAIKNEKMLASKSFKDLKDLQPANPEETEIQNKASKVVELYLDSLNSMETSLAQQSQSDFESLMNKSTAQMDEAITELYGLVNLLEQ